MCCCCDNVRTREKEDFYINNDPTIIRAAVLYPEGNNTLKLISSIALESFKGAEASYYTNPKQKIEKDVNVLIRFNSQGSVEVLGQHHTESQQFTLMDPNRCILNDVTEMTFCLVQAFPKAERQEPQTRFAPPEEPIRNESSIYSPRAGEDSRSSPMSEDESVVCTPREPTMPPSTSAF